MSDCGWKTPSGSTNGIVVWSISAKFEHCPRCCGPLTWDGWRGVCATGHFLIVDGWER
jgi:hypothetical protein